MTILRTKILPVLAVLFFFCAFSMKAQEGKKYEFLPAPDIWYNDVDGIRLGLRVKGQVPGTFEDGPHRLDLGFWFGTWIPDTPVSYYLSYTEPIQAISNFGSEGNVQLTSSVRTGLHRHGVSLNKRWQNGFDEQNFKELSLGFHAQKRFEERYVPFPQLWQPEWLGIAELSVGISNENRLGRLYLNSLNTANLLGDHSGFFVTSNEIQQLITLGSGFEIRGRGFIGISSNQTAPEFLFTHSFMPAVGWIEKGLTRAKGTIPTPWIDSGVFQVAGGPNLRGYTQQDIEALNGGAAPLFTSMGAFNLELDFPNPLNNAIQKVPVAGGVLKLRSYLFGDIGTSLGFTDLEEDRTLSDAGIGLMLSLNIPDYLGKPRGIMIRYDVPFWLSDPEDGNNFSYRNIIGIGAVISL